MTPGKTYKFSIKVFNVGQMPWTYANHTSISPVNEDTTLFNATRLNLTKGQTVKRGQNYLWNFILKTPSQCGNYTLEFRMINNNTTWFGDTFIKNVTVGNPGDDVIFVSQSVQYYPAIINQSSLSMKSMVWKNVSISVKNMGRYNWSASDNITLAAVDYEPNDAIQFKSAQLYHIAPNDVIMPGEVATWKFKIQAPQNPGVYHIKYRMQKDGQWFGNMMNVTVKVT
jgi:hypothetical protein